MSFAKAKRFNYKLPDIDVSPADYNISSALEKGYHIGKCPRFHQKCFSKDGSISNSVCSRLNCCRDADSSVTSTPNKQEHNSTYSSTNKEKATNFNRSRSYRSSVRQNSFGNRPFPSNDANQAATTTRRTIADLVDRFENPPRPQPFIGREEFIDDDYHSFTSSEELETLYKIEEYEFEEVCNALNKLRKNERNRNFEDIVLEKMESIEKQVGQFKKELADLNGKLHSDQVQRQQEIVTMSTLGTDTIPKRNQDEIRKIITKAIKKLGDEFENKRKSILKQSEQKINQLIKEIYTTSENSTKDIEKLCDATSAELSEKLINILDRVNVPALEYQSSEHFDTTAREMKEAYFADDSIFNYENICKVLSDHLQTSKDELVALEQDNLDMTLKYSSTQQALEEQSSVIDMLYSEISALRQNFT